MAILKQDPLPVLLTVADQLLSLEVLALSKRDGFEFLSHVHLLCKLDELQGWISSLRKYKDDRSDLVRVLVEHLHTSGRRLSELLTDLFSHVL